MEATPQRAGRREWIGLAVIALPCLLYAMDLTVLYLAVPSLTEDLDPTSSQLLWISDVYGFLVAGFLITMGTLGDRIGRRKLLLIGAAAFGATSALAAFSTSAEMLILCRALQGVAAATLAPSTLSLISNMFRDPGQRTMAIGIWAMSFSAGAALGPVLGGVLLEFAWWGSVFLLNVPVMALLLVLGPRLLPEYRDPGAGRFDLFSAGLSLVAILAVIYGVKGMAEHGLTASNVAPVVFGVAVAVVFLRRQRRLADPLLDLELFRRAAFRIALMTNTLGIFVIGGTLLFIAQYLQLVLGMGPLEAGLWALPGALGFVVGSLAAPHIVRRVDPGLVVAVGMAVAAVGLALMTQVTSSSGLAVLIAGDVVMSFGVALVVTLTTDLIVASVPPERAGTASGLSETGAELGGALGVAVLGSIGVAIYRSGVSDSLPDGLSAEAHAAASDTLAGALSADDLPAGVLSAATEAFTDGLQVAALTGAVLAAVLAIAAALVLRDRAPQPHPEPCAEAAMATADC